MLRGDIHPQANSWRSRRRARRRCRQYGSVEIPRSDFLAALKMGDD